VNVYTHNEVGEVVFISTHKYECIKNGHVSLKAYVVDL